MSVFIIAEVGVNHNGSFELAEKLIHAAAAAGADAVKFQTFNAEELVLAGADQADYQRQSAPDNDQLTMLKKLEMPLGWIERLHEICESCQVEFMSTAFDREAAEHLRKYIKRIKIPSGELTNIPFIQYLTTYDLPLILSTGMGSMQEIEEAVEAIVQTRTERAFDVNLEDILTILHCTSSYPTQLVDVNMKALQTISGKFGVPVGYSDHTQGEVASMTAVAMGGQVIEKHITLDTNLPGPDHQASLEPDAFESMVNKIREVELCLGDGVKAPREDELAVRRVARRGLVLLNPRKKGECLEASDIGILRPEGDIAPKYFDRLVGAKLLRDVAGGQSLQWEDIEE